MTIRTDPSASATGAVVICPRCGRSASVDAVVCAFCWQTLREEHTADDRRAARAIAAEQAAERRQQRARQIAGIRVVLLAILIAFVVWRVQFNGPTLIPTPQSTAYSSVTPEQQPASWPLTDGDAGRTRATAAPSHINGALAWRATLDSAVTTQPVVGERALFVGVRDAALVALSLGDGRELWRTAVPGQLDAAPTLAGGRLYAPLRDGQIMALDPSDGRVIWTEGDGPSFVSSPLVADGVVYAASLGDVRAFDAETGRLLWRHVLGGSVPSPAGAALSAHELVVATYDSVEVYSRSTGEQSFFYKLRAPGHLLIEGGQVFVTGSNRIVAFGFEQRRPWWEGMRTAWFEMWIFGMAPAPPDPPSHWVAPTGAGTQAPALAADVLVVTSANGQTRGFDAGTGAERWKYIGRPPAAPPTTTQDGVLLVESDALVLIDPATGAEKTRRVLAGEQPGAITVTSVGSYFVTHGNEVVALR